MMFNPYYFTTILFILLSNIAFAQHGPLDDLDGDSILNIDDLDDDNDGILDINECSSIAAAQFEASTAASGTLSLPLSGGSANWQIENSGQETIVSSGLSDNNDLHFVYNNSQPWDLTSVFEITDVPTGTLVKLRLNGFIDNTNLGNTSPDFGSKFSNYTISWTGGTANAQALIFDPQGSQIVGGNQAIINGGSFTQDTGDFATTGAWSNNLLEWYVDFPLGATQFTIVAEGGFAIEGFRFSAIEVTCQDTDGDGIADLQDLDSDNDGCPDALEGTGSYTYVDLTNDALNSEIDATGIPVIATASGQLVGTGTDVNQVAEICLGSDGSCVTTTGIDTDADGIYNECDLDDDNDGILDINECSATAAAQFAASTPTTGTLSLPLSGGSANWQIANAGQETIVSSGLSDNNDLHFVYNNSQPWDLSSVFEITNVPSGTLIKLRLNGFIDKAILGNASVDFGSKFSNYTISWAGGADNAQALIFDPQGSQIVGGNQAIVNGGSFTQDTGDYASTGAWSNNLLEWYVDFPLGATQFTIAAAGGFAIEGFRFSAIEVTCQDTDGDGVADLLDTDSDNDGCPDAIEGTGNYTYADLASNALIGEVDEAGIPVVATATGQLVGTGTDVNQIAEVCLTPICETGIDTDGDGVDDGCDQDDDNDGVLDVNECLATAAAQFGTSTSTTGTATTGTLSLPISGGSADWQIVNAGQQSIVSSGLSDNNDLHFVYNNSQSWDLASVFEITNVPAGTLVKLRLSGFVDNTFSGDTDPAFGSKFSTYTIGWEGGSNNAQALIFDPQGSQIVGGNQAIINGGSFTQDAGDYASTGAWSNNLLEWYIDFPLGATEFTIIAKGGFALEGFRFSAIEVTCQDTDGDGIADLLDLDSDNDGCPDALEGTGGFTFADITNDALIGDVDEAGVPYAASTAGQFIGTGTDVTQTSDACISADDACQTGIDTDADGVDNGCDLDDDNDGILDVNECSATAAAQFTAGTRTTGTLSLPLSGGSANWQISNAGQEAVVSSGLSDNNDLHFVYNNSEPWNLFSVFEITNVPAGTLVKLRLNGFVDKTFEGNTSPDFGSKFSNYTISWEGGTENAQALIFDPQGSQIVGGNQAITNGGSFTQDTGDYPTTGAWSNNLLEWYVDFPLGATQFAIVAEGGFAIEGFRFSAIEVTCQDTDGDGVADLLDLDSDNDGCPDALEGTGGYTYDDLTNNALTGAVDEAGISTNATAAGQFVGTGTDANQVAEVCLTPLCETGIDTDGDGVDDGCDQDDDNDGVLDVNECSATAASQFTTSTATTGTLSLPISGGSADWQIANAGQESIVSSGLSDNNDLHFVYNNSQPWDLASVFEISNVPTGTLIKLRLSGFVDHTFSGDTDPGFGSKFSTYTIGWEGGADNAQALIFDPQGSQIVGGNQAIINGGSFTQDTGDYASTGAWSNNLLEWYVDFPLGATEFTIIAKDGFALEGFRFSAIEVTCQDTDGDGIADLLDLDSDNDGCPDALEGTGGFTFADITNDALIGAVDAAGIPITATTAGQFAGTGTDPNQLGDACFMPTCDNPSGVDTDEDGLDDACDLDDDNDGVLDINECSATAAGNFVVFTETAGQLNLPISNETANWQIENSGQESIISTGLSDNNELYFVYGNSQPWDLNAVFEISNVPAGTLVKLRLDGFVDKTFLDNTNPGFGSKFSNYSISWVGGDNNAQALLFDPQGGQIVGGNQAVANGGSFTQDTGDYPSTGAWSNDLLQWYIDFPLGASQFTIAAEGGFALEGFRLSVIEVTCQDTDGDGIADLLDLDSDNDGCPDALEGSSNFTYNDLTNDALTGAIDEAGIPIVATAAGQLVGTGTDVNQVVEECEAAFSLPQLVQSIAFAGTVENEIKVYPNPVPSSSGNLTIEFYATSQQEQFEVIDMLGRVVRSLTIESNPESMNNRQLDISGLTPGMYIVKSIKLNTATEFIIR